MFRVGQGKNVTIKRFARAGGDPFRRLRPRTDVSKWNKDYQVNRNVSLDLSPKPSTRYIYSNTNGVLIFVILHVGSFYIKHSKIMTNRSVMKCQKRLLGKAFERPD